MNWHDRASLSPVKKVVSMAHFGVRVAGLFYLTCVALPAFAGPPFQTDDPEPVDYKHYEFYVASQQTLTENGRSGTLPHFEFNYGALPDLQLHIILPLAFDSPSGGSWHSGLGDIELGAKYRFIQESDYVPMVGTFPLYEVPTGDADKGLGNGGSQFFLPIWLQKKWGEWQSYGGGGYWIVNGGANKNYWFFGWQVQRDLSEHVTLGAEIFHKTQQVDGQGDSTGFNVGGFYNFDEHHHLLFSAGRGLQNADATNKFSSYVAFQWTY